MLQRSNGLWRWRRRRRRSLRTGYFDTLGTSKRSAIWRSPAGFADLLHRRIGAAGVAQVYGTARGDAGPARATTSPESSTTASATDRPVRTVGDHHSFAGGYACAEAHRPCRAPARSVPARLSPPTGHAGQAVLEIGNSGDETLQFDNAPARGRDVPLQPRSCPPRTPACPT